MYNPGNIEGLKARYQKAIDSGDHAAIIRNRFALLGYSYTDQYGDSADLSTVDPNPSVGSLNNTSSPSDLTSMMSTAGQWGATIAGIVTSNQNQPAPIIIRPTGAGQTSVLASGGMGPLLLLLIAGVVIYMLIER